MLKHGQSQKCDETTADAGDRQTEDMEANEDVYWDFQESYNSFLGQGSFGTVFLYHHKETREEIAVKKLDLRRNVPHREEEELMVAVKIMRELSQDRHPNIVLYLFEHIDKEACKVCIGMEYMPGGSLKQKIDKEGRLSGDTIENYTHQILRGVAFLHDKRIVHQDIKSSNILMDMKDCIKLADFGIQKHLSTPIMAHGATKEASGTCQYMSPEAILKGFNEYSEEQGYGTKTDIWSVGCVVLEMASGKRPWNTIKDPYEVMHVVRNGEAPPIPDNVSEDVKDIIVKTFVVNPRDRPSAVELLQYEWRPPDLGSEITITSISAASATVFLKRPSRDGFERYSVTLERSDSGETAAAIPKDAACPSTVLSNLVPGTKYTVNINTVKGSKDGAQKMAMFVTLPPDLGSEITITWISTTSATAAFEPPSGGCFDGYSVTVDPSDSGETAAAILKEAACPSTVLSNLVPGTKYTVMVNTVNGDEDGAQAMTTFVTLPPDIGSEVAVNSIATTTATAVFEAPSAGRFDCYKISITPWTNGETLQSLVNQSETTWVAVLSNLVPGTDYEVAVGTFKGGVAGKQKTRTFVTNRQTLLSRLLSIIASRHRADAGHAEQGGSVAADASNDVHGGGDRSDVNSDDDAADDNDNDRSDGCSRDDDAADDANYDDNDNGRSDGCSRDDDGDDDLQAGPAEDEPEIPQTSGAVVQQIANVSGKGNIGNFHNERGTIIFNFKDSKTARKKKKKPKKARRTALKRTVDAEEDLRVPLSGTEQPRGPPDISSEIIITSISTTSATASFERPSSGFFERYALAIYPRDKGETASDIPKDAAFPSSALSNLVPGTEYTIVVNAVKGNENGVQAMTKFITWPPDIGSDVAVTSITSTTATAIFEAPSFGRFDCYKVTIFPWRNGETLTSLVNKSETTWHASFSNLVPGTDYKVAVGTFKKDVAGAQRERTFTTCNYLEAPEATFDKNEQSTIVDEAQPTICPNSQTETDQEEVGAPSEVVQNVRQTVHMSGTGNFGNIVVHEGGLFTVQICISGDQASEPDSTLSETVASVQEQQCHPNSHEEARHVQEMDINERTPLLWNNQGDQDEPIDEGKSKRWWWCCC